MRNSPGPSVTVGKVHVWSLSLSFQPVRSTGWVSGLQISIQSWSVPWKSRRPLTVSLLLARNSLMMGERTSRGSRCSKPSRVPHLTRDGDAAGLAFRVL